jgi:hypothetical protein
LPIGLGISAVYWMIRMQHFTPPITQKLESYITWSGERDKFKTVLIRQKMVMKTTVCIKYKVEN